MKKILSNKQITILLVGILLLQSMVYLYFGSRKNYLHMDEAYSLGLTHYKNVEIQNNEDFYDTWHDGNYYEEYLVVQKEERQDFRKVYENQRDDVHPPVYYLFLRFFQNNLNEFSKWPGIILNIIIGIFSTIFLFLFLKCLFQDEIMGQKKAIFLTFFASLTLSTISSIIYIRMYALTGLFVLMTSYFHIKIWKNPKNIKNYVGIFFTALLGSLTHYYYLFYLFFLFAFFLRHFFQEKDWSSLKKYVFSILLAAAVSLMIFPYSIKHLFFGYRGQGALENLLHPEKFLVQLGAYFMKLNQYTFHFFLFFFLITMLVFWICGKKNNTQMKFSNPLESIFFFSCCAYFLLVSFLSPYIELRYILPICSLFFCLFFSLFLRTLCVVCENYKWKIFLGILILGGLSFWYFDMKPEVLYESHKQIVDEIQEQRNIPTLYFLDPNNNRFLDDILLFSILEQSYITQDLSYDEEKLKEIVKEKDISSGIYVFLNQGNNNESALNKIKSSLNLSTYEHRFHLNACDIYFLS